MAFSLDSNNLLRYGNGPVCDDSFGVDEANAVCRIMGYGGSMSYSTSQGTGTADFTMDDLECPIGTSELSSCSWTMEHNCGSTEGVQLYCREAPLLPLPTAQ